MSRRLKKKQEEDEIEEEVEENEEVDEENDDDNESEITRCVCNNDELKSVSSTVSSILLREYSIKVDTGLFIQCDQCSVWQHGYCVGLFHSNDVPDKYWCELCKPAYHIYVSDTRTLYKLVNDRRKKLLPRRKRERERGRDEKESDRENPVRERKLESRDSRESRDRNLELKESRDRSSKLRRSYEDSYDAQLQKALRESVKDSKKSEGDDQNEADEREEDEEVEDAEAEDEQDDNVKKEKEENQDKENQEDQEQDTAKNEDVASVPNSRRNSPDPPTSKVKRTKLRKLTKSIKKLKSNATKLHSPALISLSSSSSKKMDPNLQISRDELINKPSKPRYISDKSSIFDLRKRTSAILEWLERSQIELDEEKILKTSLLENDTNINNKSINVSILQSFDENLNLMEELTNLILSWEQKFGKYAP